MKANVSGNRTRTAKGSLITFGLLGVMLVVGGLLVWSASVRSTVRGNKSEIGSLGVSSGASTPGPTQQVSASPSPTSQAVTELPPPPTCHYCAGNLVGKTADEIGQYALQYTQNNHIVRSGTPQILLSRPITREAYTALGLGCLPEFGVIEPPPLALVILKGDFDLNSFGGAHAPIRQDLGEIIYLGYVFDLWAGMPTSWQTTKSGGTFRTALNDPSLPDDGNEPSACPPGLPLSQATLHYGDPAPGFTTPPPLPTDIRPYTPVPANTSTAVAPVDNSRS